jgi:glycosyltransferase involved in cell wall biosynthesis
LIVVPAYNESASIARVVQDVRAHVPSADILVVDDGSVDGTSAAARTAGAVVVTLPFNLGVGGAMRTGFRYALRNGYNTVVQIDGDGQHDARYIPAVIDSLADADVVVGARFAGEGAYRVRGPRRWAMRLLGVVVSRVAGTRLTDVTSGFRAANRRAIRVFSAHYPAEYLGDTVESLVIAARAGLTIRQVPVEMRFRTSGVASHRPWRATMYLVRAVMALLLALVRTWPETSPEPGGRDEV